MLGVEKEQNNSNENKIKHFKKVLNLTRRKFIWKVLDGTQKLLAWTLHLFAIARNQHSKTIIHIVITLKKFRTMWLQPPNGPIWVIRFRVWPTTITIRWHQHNIVLSIKSPLFPALPFLFTLPVRRSYFCSLNRRKLQSLSLLKTPFRRWLQLRAAGNWLFLFATPQPPRQTS